MLRCLVVHAYCPFEISWSCEVPNSRRDAQQSCFTALWLRLRSSAARFCSNMRCESVQCHTHRCHAEAVGALLTNEARCGSAGLTHAMSFDMLHRWEPIICA